MSKDFSIPDVPETLREGLKTFLWPTEAAAYRAYQWTDRFPNDEDITAITTEFPSRISRRDVAGLAVHSVRRLFLGSYIWGRNNDNRGPYYADKILSNGKAIETMKDMCQLVDSGDIASAYLSAVKNGRRNKLSGWGPSFFTKLLYFKGLYNDNRILPVILDNRVATSLKRLSDGQSWDHNSFGRFQRTRRGQVSIVGPDVEGYMNLVATFHQWAHELGCRADTIERYLFHIDQGSSKP